MLEKKLVQLAVKGLTEEDYPSFIKPSCLNSRQRKYPCSVCVEVCPTGALLKPSGEVADWDKCVGCGLCVVKCPAAAISPSYQSFKQVLRLITTKRSLRMLTCEKSDSDSDYAPWCLASIPWELLASLALSGEVIIERAQCGHCERSSHLAQFHQAMSRARDFLGEAFFDARVTLLAEGDMLPPVDLTRREALRTLSLGARMGVGAILPDTQKLDNSPLFIRRLLHRQVRSSLENAAFPEVYSWITPQVDGGVCWGCGICEKVCPHQAPKVYLAQEENQRYLLHYPDRCTQCGLCQSICPDQAITGYTNSPLPSQVKFFITPVLTTHCEGCGGPLRPVEAGSLCLRCKARQKKRW